MGGTIARKLGERYFFDFQIPLSFLRNLRGPWCPVAGKENNLNIINFRPRSNINCNDVCLTLRLFSILFKDIEQRNEIKSAMLPLLKDVYSRISERPFERV